MVGILSPDFPAILSIKKLVGHSDIKTTQRYYLSVQEDDLEKARQVQSEILGGVLTDPLSDPLAGSGPQTFQLRLWARPKGRGRAATPRTGEVP